MPDRVCSCLCQSIFKGEMRLIIVVPLNYLVSKWMFQYLHNGYASNSLQPPLMCRVLIDSRSAVMLPAVVPNRCIPLFLFLVFRFHYNDAAAIHQLQNEVCGPPPMEDAHLQGSQYLYWWPVCLRHQDAHDVQDRMPQRRYAFPDSDVFILYFLEIYQIKGKLTSLQTTWMCSQIIFTMNSF